MRDRKRDLPANWLMQLDEGVVGWVFGGNSSYGGDEEKIWGGGRITRERKRQGKIMKK